jgi:cytidine deaminase
MIADGYPRDSSVPSILKEEGEEKEKMVKVMTLEELLPMSFGPEQLQ